MKLFKLLFVLIFIVSCSEKDNQSDGPRFKYNDYNFIGTDKNQNGVSDQFEERLAVLIDNDVIRKACLNFIQSEIELLSRDDVSLSKDAFIKSERNSTCLLGIVIMFGARFTMCSDPLSKELIGKDKELSKRNRRIGSELLSKYESHIIRGLTILDMPLYCDFYIPELEKKLTNLLDGKENDEHSKKIHTAVDHNNAFLPRGKK